MVSRAQQGRPDRRSAARAACRAWLAGEAPRAPEAERLARGARVPRRPRRSNLLAAHQELQKLALLAPEGELSLDTVRGAVADVARYDTYVAAEALVAGDTARYLRVLEGLRGEGEAPTYLLFTLSSALFALYRRAREQDDAVGARTRAPLPQARALERAIEPRRRGRPHDQGNRRRRAVGGVRQARARAARRLICWTSPASPSFRRTGRAPGSGHGISIGMRFITAYCTRASAARGAGARSPLRRGDDLLVAHPACAVAVDDAACDHGGRSDLPRRMLDARRVGVQPLERTAVG